MKTEQKKSIQTQSEAYLSIASDKMNRERNNPNLISSDYYWQRKRREVVRLIERNSDHFQDADLLVELGCGVAPDIWAIRDALKSAEDLHFECMEADPKALSLARARRGYHGIQEVSFVEGDITKTLPWDGNSVDIIYTSEVFEHIPEIDRLVGEVSRIIKRGGYLLLTTPNEPNLFQRSFYSRRRRKEIVERNAKDYETTEDGTKLYGHVTLMKNSEWDALMASNGFDLVDYGRGAVWYGGTYFHDSKFVLATEFFLEGILDLLPRSWVRNISDQVIALYQKR